MWAPQGHLRREGHVHLVHSYAGNICGESQYIGFRELSSAPLRAAPAAYTLVQRDNMYICISHVQYIGGYELSLLICFVVCFFPVCVCQSVSLFYLSCFCVESKMGRGERSHHLLLSRHLLPTFHKSGRNKRVQASTGLKSQGDRYL